MLLSLKRGFMSRALNVMCGLDMKKTPLAVNPLEGHVPSTVGGG
jgi:hypothetical protein